MYSNICGLIWGHASFGFLIQKFVQIFDTFIEVTPPGWSHHWEQRGGEHSSFT